LKHLARSHCSKKSHKRTSKPGRLVKEKSAGESRKRKEKTEKQTRKQRELQGEKLAGRRALLRPENGIPNPNC